MAARKKKVVKKRKVTARKPVKRKTPVRKKRAAFTRKRKTAVKKTTAKKAPAKKRSSRASLALDAIKRDADAQVICGVMLELDINHHEVSTDKDYMKVTMSPKDAVAFYNLLLQKITRPFKESLDCNYKTNSCDWVIVSIPVNMMKDVNKVLSITLQASK